MSLGLLFSGQGTQHPQMLPWLADDDPLVRRTGAALKTSDWRRALHDHAWAVCNRHAQVLITGLGLAAWGQLAPRLPPPAALAGYSVGELAAFSTAGVFDAATALWLAGRRAQAMDRCAASVPGGLVAVTGLDPSAIDTLCADTGVSVAIRLAADAVVLGGPSAALQSVSSRAGGLGAKVSPLKVAVASHTPAMQAAADAFEADLGGVSIHAPSTALVCNLTGERVQDSHHAAQVLAQQIAHTVRWDDTLEALHARRVTCVLEIGAGSTLADLWMRRFDVPARSADEFRSADALVGWVLRQLDR